MNRKVPIILALLLLSLQLLPAPVIYAETVVEEVPNSEQTLPSKADDPLKAVKDSLPEPMAPKPEISEEPVDTKPISEPKAETTTESAESTEQTQPAIRPLGGGIGPQTTNLVEGVDIDAEVAQLLRTDPSVQDLGASWSGYGKSPNQLTDDDMAMLTKIDLSQKNLNSVTGIKYATNLKDLNLWNNNLSQIDLTDNKKLEKLDCSNNNLNDLDVSLNINLISLNVYHNSISSLDLSNNLKLEILVCDKNNLSSIDVSMLSELTHLTVSENNFISNNLDISNNTKLIRLSCYRNNLNNLDIQSNHELQFLDCSYNSLGSLNVEMNKKLEYLYCIQTNIASLNLEENTELKYLYCYYNNIDELDMRQNTLLQVLNCSINDNLGKLDLSTCTELLTLNCARTNLKTLDISVCEKLQTLDCSDSTNRSLKQLITGTHEKLETLICVNNNIRELDVSTCKELKTLNCFSNEITHLDVSSCEKLQTLSCGSNRIFDITSAFGLDNLTDFDAYGQEVRAPIPEVNSNQAIVDILKTSAQAGLSSSNGDITPPPIISATGDQIHLSNVTRQDLINREIYFEYDNTQLTEGAAGGSKRFTGRIRFYEVSELKSELTPDKKKVKSGEEILWTWKLINLFGGVSAEDIKAKLVALPAYFTIDPSSIEVNGNTGSIADIDGTNSLGYLNMQNETIIIQFKTTVTGNVEEWKELSGRVDWDDNTGIGPYYRESKGQVQIQDDEQSYTPQDSEEMGILSAPIYLNFGVQKLSASMETYQLDSLNYQTNTNVVTDGFYTRIKDDRTSNAGWKLSASLSKFVDATNQEMPNGVSTTLSLNNLSIERVNDRDSQQEVIESPPSGIDVPSFYQSSETLQSGQTAKTLVRAEPNEGMGTWQLRIPFDNVSLNVPANAGKKGTVYKAKLTWSLNDTP